MALRLYVRSQPARLSKPKWTYFDQIHTKRRLIIDEKTYVVKVLKPTLI